MKLKIEKETKYRDGELITRYWVWVNNVLTEGFRTEAEAMDMVNKIKNSPHKIGSEVIFEEEI